MLRMTLCVASLLAFFVAGACASGNSSETVGVVAPFGPLVHFAPKENWINDLNGPVIIDGRDRLFYQYNPSGTTWGNIGWGTRHPQRLATSKCCARP